MPPAKKTRGLVALEKVHADGSSMDSRFVGGERRAASAADSMQICGAYAAIGENDVAARHTVDLKVHAQPSAAPPFKQISLVM